ncbi:MAG: Gentisate 1,2-dioxygenase [Chloroflexi bacterium]|nr:Gentisate 1,2-dioxygenase [Chloroflexota bacterium]
MQDGSARPTLRPIPETPYQKWVKEQGLPVYTGAYVEDLHAVELAPWSTTGQKAAIVNLAEQEKNDGWLIEIEPGGQTDVMHHICESAVYVVDGRGATTIWQHGSDKKQTVEWQTASLFAPPLNCHYQHFNLDGRRPARLFSATTMPLLVNIFKNADFVFDCPSVFAERYDGADDFFTDPGRRVGERLWQTNFVPDTRAFKLEGDARGRGSTNMAFLMADNAMRMHISEFPIGTYKKAHRHTAGAELIILGGVGYSLLWNPGEERTQVEWREGSVFSPRNGEYHQHFNTGPVPARYLAIYTNMVIENTKALRGADVSEREGGWQIEYEDEDPAIYALFEDECRKHDAVVTQPKPRISISA